jgi:DNA-binding transcriptional ArsR family regulator
VDDVLSALGAPRRREILQLVWDGERSAGEIHRALGDVTFGAVSQHLGVLERSHLVTARRDGRSRLYRARPEGLSPLRSWLESMWDQALSSLKDLAEAEEAQRLPAGPAGRSRRRPRPTRRPARTRRRPAPSERRRKR